MSRKVRMATMSGGMAAVIVATAAAGVPTWATVALVVLAVPVLVLTVLTWVPARGGRHG